jgi:ATP-dependent Clp protease ATP-binding subunit ClpC
VKIKALLAEKNRTIIAKDKAVENEKYEEALVLKKEEDDLDRKIKKIKEEAHKAEGQKKAKILDAKVISKIATDIIGVPKEDMNEYEIKKIKNLEKVLTSRVIGQDKAINTLAKVIRRHRANISNPGRPIGSFIFIGPTGVGKTELVKSLAEELFGSQKNLIKIDMSEFMERHNVSRLLGAPPGYVGFEEGGKLTEQVRLKPYSVILFDEIEKAHPEVVNILLQILEDGVLSDAQGKKINFKNTIIILTSNLGSEEFTSSASALGFSGLEGDKKLQDQFEAIKNKTLVALKDKFKPELLNRIDEVIVFSALDLANLEKITALRFREFAARLKNNKTSITKPAIKKIAKMSLNPAYGARMVRKNIQNLIEDPIAEKIINGEIKEGDKIVIDIVKDGKVEIKVSR